MLTYEEKVYLIKKVDCHALTETRKTAIVDFFRIFPRSIEDVDQISDMVYLQRETLLTIFNSI